MRAGSNYARGFVAMACDGNGWSFRVWRGRTGVWLTALNYGRRPCHNRGMVKHSLFLIVVGALVLALASIAHAQNASAVFNGPQNMDQGLQMGLNNITGYVYSILKFLSLIGLGVAYYF